jgi:hypothetical protein
MTLFQIVIDNDIFFYGIGVGVVCHLGFSLLGSNLYSRKTETGVQTTEVMTETGVQTNA